MLIEINPIYHIMELFRQCVYYGKPMDLDLLLGASAWSFGVLLLGIFIFNKKVTILFSICNQKNQPRVNDMHPKS